MGPISARRGSDVGAATCGFARQGARRRGDGQVLGLLVADAADARSAARPVAVVAPSVASREIRAAAAVAVVPASGAKRACSVGRRRRREGRARARRESVPANAGADALAEHSAADAERPAAFQSPFARARGRVAGRGGETPTRAIRAVRAHARARRARGCVVGAVGDGRERRRRRARRWRARATDAEARRRAAARGTTPTRRRVSVDARGVLRARVLRGNTRVCDRVLGRSRSPAARGGRRGVVVDATLATTFLPFRAAARACLSRTPCTADWSLESFRRPSRARRRRPPATSCPAGPLLRARRRAAREVGRRVVSFRNRGPRVGACGLRSYRMPRRPRPGARRGSPRD